MNVEQSQAIIIPYENDQNQTGSSCAGPINVQAAEDFHIYWKGHDVPEGDPYNYEFYNQLNLKAQLIADEIAPTLEKISDYKTGDHAVRQIPVILIEQYVYQIMMAGKPLTLNQLDYELSLLTQSDSNGIKNYMPLILARAGIEAFQTSRGQTCTTPLRAVIEELLTTGYLDHDYYGLKRQGIINLLTKYPEFAAGREDHTQIDDKEFDIKGLFAYVNWVTYSFKDGNYEDKHKNPYRQGRHRDRTSEFNRGVAI